jgi:hypothetical protein
MTKSERNPNDEIRRSGSRCADPVRALEFGFRSSIVIRLPRRSQTKAGHSSMRSAAFTLVEALAALAFMAIVIPVAIHAMRIAAQAGEVAKCKSQAGRIAELVLNQSLVTTNWSQAQQTGTIIEGEREFQWTLKSQIWNEDPMRLLSVEVKYQVQDRNLTLQLNTLVDGSTPFKQTGTTVH